MLAKERLDFSASPRPDHRHAEVVFAAVAAGVKGIYCEKPMATTLADADRMIAITEEARGRDGRQPHPPLVRDYQHARDLIRAGHLGRVTHLHANCGGPRMLFRNGTHLIDIGDLLRGRRNRSGSSVTSIPVTKLRSRITPAKAAATPRSIRVARR